MCGCELSWLSCRNGASKPLRHVFNRFDISNPKGMALVIVTGRAPGAEEAL